MIAMIADVSTKITHCPRVRRFPAWWERERRESGPVDDKRARLTRQLGQPLSFRG
jgi:hypothetical protein